MSIKPRMPRLCTQVSMKREFYALALVFGDPVPVLNTILANFKEFTTVIVALLEQNYRT